MKSQQPKKTAKLFVENKQGNDDECKKGIKINPEVCRKSFQTCKIFYVIVQMRANNGSLLKYMKWLLLSTFSNS